MKKSTPHVVAETPAPAAGRPWWQYQVSVFTLLAVAFFAAAVGYGIGTDRGRPGLPAAPPAGQAADPHAGVPGAPNVGPPADPPAGGPGAPPVGQSGDPHAGHDHEAAAGAPPMVSESAAEKAIRETADQARLVEMGNTEFDGNRPRLAVLAYERALKIGPDNADVRTDLGVMYRALKRYDDAIAQFEAAGKLSPKHENSVFNLGIVAFFDTKDYARAIRAFEEYLRVAPNGDRAGEARANIAEARKLLPK